MLLYLLLGRLFDVIHSARSSRAKRLCGQQRDVMLVLLVQGCCMGWSHCNIRSIGGTRTGNLLLGSCLQRNHLSVELSNLLQSRLLHGKEGEASQGRWFMHMGLRHVATDVTYHFAFAARVESPQCAE